MERKYSIDILRILSAIAVIIIHIVSAPITNSGAEVDKILATNLNSVHNLMNWSVPVFFMITGYCLLKKSEVTYKYCFSHVLKYICVLFTVGLFYALVEQIFTVGSINVSVFLASVRNVIAGNIWDHMWFVYAIIGIYLVMPVIHHFMQQGKNSILILTALLFAFTIVLPSVEEYFPFGVSLPFGGYLFYVCFGGAMAKFEIDKKWLWAVGFGGLLSAVYIVCFAKNQQLGYKHIAVCIMAMSIFIMISRAKISSGKALLCVSQCTWGIYLIHPFFINVAIKLLKIDFLTMHAYIKLLVFAVAIALVSFGATYMLRKIPIIKKLF